MDASPLKERLMSKDKKVKDVSLTCPIGHAERMGIGKDGLLYMEVCLHERKGKQTIGEPPVMKKNGTKALVQLHNKQLLGLAIAMLTEYQKSQQPKGGVHAPNSFLSMLAALMSDDSPVENSAADDSEE